MFGVFLHLVTLVLTVPVDQTNVAQTQSQAPISGAVDNSSNTLNLNNNTAGGNQFNVAQQNSGANQTVIGSQHISHDTHKVNVTNYNDYQVNVTNDIEQTFHKKEETIQNLYTINQIQAPSGQAQGYAQQQAPPPPPPPAPASAQSIAHYGSRPSNQDILAMIMHAKETSDSAFKLAIQLYQ